MTIDMSQFYEVFFDEAEELLAEAERLLLGITIDDPDPEELNAIFRAAHSIKGGAATFGFMDMTEITHVLENLLDKIRKNEMALTAEHVDAFLAAKDVLKMELDGHRLGAVVDQDQVGDVKMMLKSLSEAGGVKIAPASETVAVADHEPVAESKQEQFNNAVQPSTGGEETIPDDGKIRFDISFPEVTDRDLVNLKDEIGLLGDVTFSKAGDKNIARLVTTDATEDDVISICSFIVDTDKISIKKLIAGQVLPVLEVKSNESAQAVVKNEASEEVKIEANSVSGKRVESSQQSHKKDQNVAMEQGYGIFAENGKDTEEDGYGFFSGFEPHPDATPVQLIGDDTPVTALNSGESQAEKIVESKPAETTISDNKPQAATKSADTEKKNLGRRESDKAPAANTESSSIRVGIEKVDQLINLVGELVITQAMIEQRVSMLDPVHNEALINSVGQLTRNTRDLQESVMSIRMMPMDFVFSRFPRMVRDLAGKLGKKVEFVTVGATTELDKSLIERIVDPLTHLVRNSVDHGVELPEIRKAAGKGDTGTLTLSAAHKGGSIVIEVTDDGGGLNRDKILAKAASNGLPVSESMSDSEVYNLIFAPGFSTAEVVTDISGRGVGMDVVKRNITSMGGNVDIRSALGFGTTISISLPLTLAILDGMSVSLGNSIYVVPLNLIVETLQPREEDIKTVTGEGRMVHVRGEYLPIIALHSIFNQRTEITDPTQGVLVILEADGKKSALFVDRLVGQQQVVIKSLETNYRKVQGVSGATIMGDGSVALILDVPALIQMGQSNNYLTGALPFSHYQDIAVN